MHVEKSKRPSLRPCSPLNFHMNLLFNTRVLKLGHFGIFDALFPFLELFKLKFSNEIWPQPQRAFFVVVSVRGRIKTNRLLHIFSCNRRLTLFLFFISRFLLCKVPWCNGQHSGLWIQWSEFKSRWDLHEFPSRATSSSPLSFILPWGNWPVKNTLRVGPLFFLWGWAIFKKFLDSKKLRKKLARDGCGKNQIGQVFFYFQGLIFQYVKKKMFAQAIAHQKTHTKSKGERKIMIGFKGHSEFCLPEIFNVRLGEHGFFYTSQLKNRRNCA